MSASERPREGSERSVCDRGSTMRSAMFRTTKDLAGAASRGRPTGRRDAVGPDGRRAAACGPPGKGPVAEQVASGQAMRLTQCAP